MTIFRIFNSILFNSSSMIRSPNYEMVNLTNLQQEIDLVADLAPFEIQPSDLE